MGADGENSSLLPSWPGKLRLFSNTLTAFVGQHWQVTFIKLCPRQERFSCSCWFMTGVSRLLLTMNEWDLGGEVISMTFLNRLDLTPGDDAISICHLIETNASVFTERSIWNKKLLHVRHYLSVVTQYNKYIIYLTDGRSSCVPRWRHTCNMEDRLVLHADVIPAI